MIQKDIERIGSKAFGMSIKPLKRTAVEFAPFVGFDTEYDSKTRKFLSFQLWHEKKGGFYTCEPTPDNIAFAAQSLIGTFAGRIILVSYFSLAELQFLPMKKGFDIREYGSRSLDVSFLSEGCQCVLSIFDLARFFDKQSLASAAESCGLEKMKWDTTKVSKATLRQPGFKKYAIHDAYLCWELTRQLRAEFMERGTDILAAKTPANASAQVFRRNYVKSEFKCDINRARYAGMRGDWGGRTETYFRGTLPIAFEYDLRSAYPSAAISLFHMPIQKSWRSGSSIRFLDSMRAGIAHVGFEFPKLCNFPCLPIIEPTAQLYVRQGHAWATFSEVLLARDLGAKITIIEAWGYKNGTTALTDYMAEVLERRAKAKGAKRIALKLQANAIIGKFAQCLDKVALDELYKVAEKEGILLEDLICMTREEQKALGAKGEVSLGSVFMPEWNALITGRVRTQLAKAIIETGAVYSATDAIWCPKQWTKPHSGFDFKRKGPAVLVRTRLGSILEKESPHIVHHSIWNREAARGLLERFAGGEDIETVDYRINRPRKYREALRSRKTFGEWITETRIASLHWDHKRELLSDGTTRPWDTVEDYRKAVANDSR